jgi:DNA-binding protein HU-beta
MKHDSQPGCVSSQYALVDEVPILLGFREWYGLCKVSYQVNAMATKSTKTKISTARSGVKGAAPKKSAASNKSAVNSKPAGKSSSGSARKKAEPGILTQAANAVSELISGVMTEPAKAGLKAGASAFLQEAAGAIGTTGKKVETTTAAAAKPSTKKTAAKPKAAAAKSKGAWDAKSGAKDTKTTKTKTGRK